MIPAFPKQTLAPLNNNSCLMMPKLQQQAPQFFSVIDDSLTDIRWLGTMDPHFPPLENTGNSGENYRAFNQPGAGPKGRKKLSYGKPKQQPTSDVKPNADSESIRPPFSYAALISLAINSHPQNMLTLNSIYRWIEDNFPFFRMPEARAWKNSIRHNLSIKKNLFQKVYIDPPRRGNGAYWTLLSEGQEEVERCMKLLMTLRPPVIDPSSVYLNQSATNSSQVIRSKGKFVPSHCESSQKERRDVLSSSPSLHMSPISLADKENSSQPGNFLVHPLEHHHSTSYPQMYPPSIQPFLPAHVPSQHSSVEKHQSSSGPLDTSNNSLLDLSYLTPLKDELAPHFPDINNISLSPFLSYWTGSKPPQQPGSGYNGSSGFSRTPNTITGLSPLCTPSKPYLGINACGEIGSGESGIYYNSSTPVKDIGEILPGCTPIKCVGGAMDPNSRLYACNTTPLRLAEFRHL